MLAAVLARSAVVERVLPAAAREQWGTLLLGSVALSLALYWPALSLGFLSDDFVLLDVASRGEAFVVTPMFWRPLPISLYAAGDALGGPVLLHLLNVVLHGLNGWLVARLARALDLGARSAVAAALLFLVFPASVEPVAWVSGLPDVLMTTMVLGGILAWGAPWRLRWRLTAAIATLIVALVSKETAIAFPLLGLAVWMKRRPWRETAVLAGSLALIVCLYGVWRSMGPMASDFAQPPSRGLLKEMLVRPFAALGAPYHADLATFGVALSLVAGIGFPLLLVANAMAWQRDRESFDRALRMALWVLIAVLPVYRYLYIAPDLQGARYLYLPAAGWAILVVGMVQAATAPLRVRGILRTVVLVLVVAVHGIALRMHLGPWREAAHLRDATLEGAIEAMAAAGCGPGSTFDVPDSARGAFVFRNGFREALSRAAPTLAGHRVCRLRWQERRFVELP